jgi:hypothetical protein
MILSRIQLYIVGVVALCGLLVGAYLYIDHSARKDERDAIRAEVNSDRIKNIEKDRANEDELDRLDDDGLLDRALRWVR